MSSEEVKINNAMDVLEKLKQNQPADFDWQMTT